MEAEKKPQINLEEWAEKCSAQLKSFPKIKEYLNQRLISDDVIDAYKIGYGLFGGKKWIVIPVYNLQKKVLYFKLRKDPFDNFNKSKYIYFPDSVQAEIFGMEDILGTETMMITEGEFDRLVAVSHGIPAITSTSGVMGFKKEWYQPAEDGVGIFSGLKKIYICFDLDKPGMTASEKLAENISSAYPFIEVYLVTLPQKVNGHEMPEGGDLSNYFQFGGDLELLFSDYAFKYESRVVAPPKKVKPQQAFDYGVPTSQELTPMDIEMAKMADISHLISDIKRRDVDGKMWLCCPFHADADPSCVIYPNGGGWCCYGGCGAGDYIDFIMRYDKIEFIPAVRKILNKN